MIREKQSNLYLLTGLVLGLIIGLAYTWFLRPVEYVNTSPASLRADYKDRQRVLIAQAYDATGNIERAKARLALLKDPDMVSALADQAQRALSDGSSPEEARLLGLLVVAVGQQEPAQENQSTTSPATSIPTGPTAAATPASLVVLNSAPDPSSAAETLLPSAEPTTASLPAITSGSPFALEDRQEICNPRQSQPLFQFLALDSEGNPLSGVEVLLTWENGLERFYTGLKPELGLGYADFTPLPGTAYSVRLGEGGQEVSGLKALECPYSPGIDPWGVIRLTFLQP